MKLSELLIDGRLPADFNAPGHGLVFSEGIRDAIIAATPDGSPHRIAPVATTDGRYACCADVLTEATSGLYCSIFSNIDWGLAAFVDVLPWVDVVALLPVPEPLEV
jgi:hypothetical protein